jgi:hypothetical protein
MEGIENRHPLLHRRHPVRGIGAEHSQNPMSPQAPNRIRTGVFSLAGSPICISDRMFLDRAGFDCLIETSSAAHGGFIRPQTRIASAIRAHPDSSSIPTDAPTNPGRAEPFPDRGSGGCHRFLVLAITTTLTFVSTRVEDPVRYESDKTPSSIHDVPSIRLTP